ncbi:MAG TPA: hypothetical protein VKE91_16665, partial [Blastocatellia bacterium]|nr:hypothetical protein [Blastocatellia bacterium]
MKSKLLFVGLIALSLLIAPAFAQKPDAGKPNTNAPQSPNSPPNSLKDASKEPAKDSDADLRRAIESSEGSETQIIVNLEGYLKKYPNSDHREEIEGELYKLSMKARDRNRAITYAERLVMNDENNIDAL